MFHKENIINIPAEHLQLLSKVLSILKISICYDDTIVTNNVTDAVGIQLINSRKTSVCLLDNQIIEEFITNFFTKMVFQNVGLS